LFGKGLILGDLRTIYKGSGEFTEIKYVALNLNRKGIKLLDVLSSIVDEKIKSLESKVLKKHEKTININFFIGFYGCECRKTKRVLL
jgi:hypothetical protein